MNYVTDTHSILWYFTEDPRLGKRALEVFERTTDKGIIIIPSVVLAEIMFIAKKGKFALSFEETLQKIALITDGKYYHATASEFELDKIYDEINKMEKKELSSRLFTQYEDRFQYFIGVALILLCIEFIIGDRKRK